MEPAVETTHPATARDHETVRLLRARHPDGMRMLVEDHRATVLALLRQRFDAATVHIERLPLQVQQQTLTAAVDVRLDSIATSENYQRLVAPEGDSAGAQAAEEAQGRPYLFFLAHPLQLPDQQPAISPPCAARWARKTW